LPRVTNPEGNLKPHIVRDGVVFWVRYGKFLGLLGVGVVAEGQLVKFVRCVCPIRDLDGCPHIDILGTYEPPWDSFAPGDMLGYYGGERRNDSHIVVHGPNDKSIKPIKADAYVIGR
jgi:hypothetical protein